MFGASKTLVGVDIGATSVKVCQLKEGRKGLVLQRFGYAPLEPQTIVDRHVMNAGALVEALQQAFASAKIRQKDVALSVSGQSVISRKITVPIMTTAELDEQLQWEAENHIPFDIKDVYVDYEILRKRPEAGQMDLLLVAAKKEEIDDYVQIAKQAKLKPTVVDIDAFTIQNVFEHNRGLAPDQTFAIINVGATQASINIISRGASAFTRDVSNGGNYLTEQLIKQLGIPYDEAEQLKMKVANPQATDVPPQVPQIVEQVCDTIAGEIQRSLDFFLATSGEERISRVFLTGGTANLRQLSEAIERRSRVACEVIQPLERIPIEGKDVNQALVQQRGAQMSVSLGLAMRKSKEPREGATTGIRVNLLPHSTDRRAATTETSQTWLLVALFLVVAEIVGLFFFHQTKEDELASIEGEVTTLQAQISEDKKTVKDHEQVKKELTKLRAREDAIAKLQAGRKGPTAVLLELSRLLTRGEGPTIDPKMVEEAQQEGNQLFNPAWDTKRLWLTAYTETERTVKLEGLARDGGDVYEFAQRLKLSVYFEDVELLPGRQKSGRGNAELVSFALQVKVKY